MQNIWDYKHTEYFIDGAIVKCRRIPNKLSFKSHYIYDLTNNKEIKRHKREKMTVKEMRLTGISCELISRPTIAYHLEATK